MQRSEAANERCFDKRDALKIAFLIYLSMSLFLVKVAGLDQEFY